ncbi:MAG: type II CAAX endopeptidase family protein [Verrucomicrobia bacterium]|nr:type II CAAX endopeptidase family protein [Verrucomicrobiota bacterium]
MTDPTVMVLIGSFATSVSLFVVFALVRGVFGRTNPAVVAVDFARMDEASAYQAPAVAALPPALPVGRVPVWFYKPLDLVGVVFVFGVFGMLSFATVRSSNGALPTMNPVTLVVGIGLHFFMAGMVAILVVRRVGWVTWLGLRWRAWYWVFVLAPGAVLFMWMVFGGLQISGYMEWMQSLGVETVQDTVKLLQKSEDPLILGLMGLAAVVVAPLCEETVFRGYFYPVMKKFAGAWSAAFCSSLVFASAHGNLTFMLPLFVFGGVLVFIYEKTGSIWAPIAVHFCFNSATVLAQIAVRYHAIPLGFAP